MRPLILNYSVSTFTRNLMNKSLYGEKEITVQGALLLESSSHC